MKRQSQQVGRREVWCKARSAATVETYEQGVMPPGTGTHEAIRRKKVMNPLPEDP